MADEVNEAGAGEEAAGVSSPRGKGFLAVGGSMFLHGLGQMMAGRYRRGVSWFLLSWELSATVLICAMVGSLMPMLIVLIPAGVVVSIWCLIDSYVVGRRSSRVIIGRPALRYLTGAA